MELWKFHGKIYGTDDVKDCLHTLGITEGDSLCVHSELFRFGAPMLPKDSFNQAICQTLLEVCGENGNLLIPTFTYSFCCNEVFDVLHSRSRVGMLGDSFLQMPHVRRTHCPIFSFALRGALSDTFMDIGIEVLGKDSIFDKLLCHNAKIITFGNPYLGYTFVHFLETIANVPYRFDKNFSGIIRDESGKESAANIIYRVRHLDQRSELDYRKVAHFLIDLGILRLAKCAGGTIGIMESQRVSEAILRALAKDYAAFLL